MKAEDFERAGKSLDELGKNIQGCGCALVMLLVGVVLLVAISLPILKTVF